MLLFLVEHHTDKTQVVINLNFPLSPMCPLSFFSSIQWSYIFSCQFCHMDTFTKGIQKTKKSFLGEAHLEFFESWKNFHTWFLFHIQAAYKKMSFCLYFFCFTLATESFFSNYCFLWLKRSYSFCLFFFRSLALSFYEYRARTRCSNQLCCGANLALFDMKTNRWKPTETPAESYMYLLWGRTRTAVYLYSASYFIICHMLIYSGSNPDKFFIGRALFFSTSQSRWFNR